jgi:hypothetical protein
MRKIAPSKAAQIQPRRAPEPDEIKVRKPISLVWSLGTAATFAILFTGLLYIVNERRSSPAGENPAPAPAAASARTSQAEKPADPKPTSDRLAQNPALPQPNANTGAPDAMPTGALQPPPPPDAPAAPSPNSTDQGVATSAPAPAPAPRSQVPQSLARLPDDTVTPPDPPAADAQQPAQVDAVLPPPRAADLPTGSVTPAQDEAPALKIALAGKDIETECLADNVKHALDAVAAKFKNVSLVSTTILHTKNHAQGSERAKIHAACHGVDLRAKGQTDAVAAFLRKQDGIGAVQTFGDGIIHADAEGAEKSVTGTRPHHRVRKRTEAQPAPASPPVQPANATQPPTDPTADTGSVRAEAQPAQLPGPPLLINR